MAATLGVGSLTAMAQSAPTMVTADCSAIHFDLANPAPGSRVEQGNAIVEGIAFDTRAPDGMGIDRVDFFLDNRDQGGLMLTQAMPGAMNVWHALATIPSNQTGLHTLTFYAHSSVTGQETVVGVPVTIAP